MYSIVYARSSLRACVCVCDSTLSFNQETRATAAGDSPAAQTTPTPAAVLPSDVTAAAAESSSEVGADPTAATHNE